MNKTLKDIAALVIDYLNIAIYLIIALAVVTFVWNVYRYFFTDWVNQWNLLITGPWNMRFPSAALEYEEAVDYFYHSNCNRYFDALTPDFFV